MTRAQWFFMVTVGAVALVAFVRSEQIARRIGLGGIVRGVTPTSGGIV